MRPLEIALWVASLPLLLWCLSHRGIPGWVRIAQTAALVLLAAHVAFEGWRWSFAPAYLLIACLFVACVWPRVPQLDPGPRIALVGFVLLGVSAAAAVVFPVFNLPGPTGRHPIGTVTLHLVDPAR